ncbi:MAG: ArsR family transcriptional regulator [Desulfurococcales archaeon]|nr:ArsR family transcriptional regulator [Desulfurococcales archaeon]RLG73425.1 MAG: ArsR family transcriptional regulator [Thermoprotei archaeon]
MEELGNDRNDPMKRLGLKVVYEDSEVVVVRAPTEDQLIKIITDLLRDKPMTVKELHSILSGLASEDKIRRALTRLVNDGRAIVSHDGRFSIVGLE